MRLTAPEGSYRGRVLDTGANAGFSIRTGNPSRKFIKRMEAKKRYYSDASERVKNWRKKQGKAILTYLDPVTFEALKVEAQRRNKPVWKLARSCIAAGFREARRRV